VRFYCAKISSMDLSQTILGVTFPNPTVLASGIWGVTASSWKRVVENGAGGVTTKSLWIREHKGHPNPTVIANEHWTLNAVGLPDAGPDKAREEIGEYLKDKSAPLIANIVAGKVEDFVAIAEIVCGLGPDFLEVNISCPNVEDECGKPFACSAPDAKKVTEAVKKVSGDVPIFIKLSPNVDDIGAVAVACAEAGADGFTAVNTFGPGMAIDLKSRQPILANKVGGLSGPGLKPIAVRCIHDVYKATGGKLPIIGTGGVHTGQDALEMMIAGASLIGIGTAIGERGQDVFKKVCDEMEEWCEEEGISEVSELVGSIRT